MEIHAANKPNRSLIQLESDSEARLCASVGFGLMSVRGIRLAFAAMKAKESGEWPIEIEVPNRRLAHVANRMRDEAARLEVVSTLPGFGEYPDAAESTPMLRDMASVIDGHLELTPSA